MRLQSWLQFLTDGIWRITEDEVTPVRKRLYSCVKIIYLSVDQFLNDRIPVRASALTYSTLLSIIPILALLFAIARGFGFDALMEEQIKSGVMSQQSELVDCYLQRSDYLHDHVCERFRDFPFIGTNAEIPGTAYPVCLDLGNVYRAICIHAQYQRQT